MKNQYEARKLDIPDYYGDNEFYIEALHDFIQHETILIHAKDEYVGPIER